MMNIAPVRAFKDNYIWVLQDDAGQAAVVDPGEAQPVIDYLREKGLTLTAILITHHHPDHVGGVPRLLETHDVPVFGPGSERVPGMTAPLGQGDRAELEAMGLSFEVLDIPGHTAGHIAYVGHGVLFSGDTLFAAGCGKVFEGTPAQMHDSLSKLAALPPETQIYCGHEYTEANLRFAAQVEPDNQAIQQRLETVAAQRRNDEVTLPSTIALELETNVFLRGGSESVKQHAEQHAGRRLDSPVDVFGTVRAWKDGR
ncbi:hydroxyacylglutathione hydrolase [Ectothiorhodospiraceae bacterium WFHF3C12]|nr:hydroxyacylglutathione hydrolase [Ectothiorhodospiraceae bacterium WFHF3C12]